MEGSGTTPSIRNLVTRGKELVRSDIVSVMISQFYFFVDLGSFNFLPTRRHGQEKILYFCTLEFWGFITKKHSMN